MLNVRNVVLAVGTGASAIGCGGPSTTIEQSWKAPSDGAGPQNLVVIHVAHDGTIRRNAEDKMVSRLAGTGVSAVQSYAVLGEDELSDSDRWRRKLATAGFDGVLAIRLISRTGSEAALRALTLDDFWSQWSTYDATYGFNEVVVRIETNVYSLNDNTLLWSALSKTVDPESVGDVIDEVTGVVSKQMQRERVVVGTR
jgi:hypothetical protein